MQVPDTFFQLKKFLSSFLMKVRNTKFQANPSSGIRADTCGQTEGRT